MEHYFSIPIINKDTRNMYVSSLCFDDFGYTETQPQRFGYTWHTMVRPVMGFQIEVEQNVIVNIENIQFGSNKHLNLVSKGSKYLFMLRSGERVTKIELQFTEGMLGGIRFTTSTRVSQWFGTSQGRLKSILPQDGYIINSIVGVMNHMTKKCKIGAVMHPMRTEASNVAIKIKRGNNMLKHTEQYVPNFIKTVKSIRALILHCPDTVTSIDVLSPEEYHDYLSLSNEIDPNPYDHWLELVGDEKLVSVKVSSNNGVVCGLRFATSMQESQWFGTPSQERSTFIVSKNQIICGFYGKRDINGISALGVATI